MLANCRGKRRSDRLCVLRDAARAAQYASALRGRLRRDPRHTRAAVSRGSSQRLPTGQGEACAPLAIPSCTVACRSSGPPSPVRRRPPEPASHGSAGPRRAGEKPLTRWAGRRSPRPLSPRPQPPAPTGEAQPPRTPPAQRRIRSGRQTWPRSARGRATPCTTTPLGKAWPMPARGHVRRSPITKRRLSVRDATFMAQYSDLFAAGPWHTAPCLAACVF